MQPYKFPKSFCPPDRELEPAAAAFRILPLNPRPSRRTLRPSMASPTPTAPTVPDSTGHFGQFGGMFVPETLMAPLQELATAYEAEDQGQTRVVSSSSPSQRFKK